MYVDKHLPLLEDVFNSSTFKLELISSLQNFINYVVLMKVNDDIIVDISFWFSDKSLKQNIFSSAYSV